MRVAVIGAGISGAACAAALRSAGIDVEVFDRARTPGGRMASPRLHGRRVDLGATYFTVRDAGFAKVVDRWQDTGLARMWTESVQVLDPRQRSRPGAAGDTPRWAARDGLRSLVRELMLIPVPMVRERNLTSLADLKHDAVVLAMPDPQAARLVPDAIEWVHYEPVMTVAMGFEQRTWQMPDAAFVNGDPDVSLVADDGARRGDDAPVLVAHSTADRARPHLTRPAGAVSPVVDAVRRLLGVRARPDWVFTHRWTFAKPTGTHGDAPYGLVEHAGRPLGFCGDSWSPEGPPRIEAAWLSGHRLGTELAAQLA